MSCQKVSERWLIACASKMRKATNVVVKTTSVISQYFVYDVDGAR